MGVSMRAVGVTRHKIERGLFFETTDDGVNVAMIRWMLSRTPKQRLDFLQDVMTSVRLLAQEFGPYHPCLWPDEDPPQRGPG